MSGMPMPLQRVGARSVLPWALAVLIALGAAGPQAAFAESDQADVHLVPGSRFSKEPGNPVLRANVDLVLVNVTVTDQQDRIVPDLQASDFALLEDKIPQRIKYFSREASPIAMGLVLDTSNSMKDYLDQSRQAVLEFFRNSSVGDQLALVAFADRPRLLVGFDDPIADLNPVLQPLQAKGSTAFWDAMYLALMQMRTANVPKKALLVLSDGGDNHSRYTEGEIRSALREADVQIYAIAPFKEQHTKAPEDRSGLLWLDEIAKETGGRLFVIHGLDELPQTMARINDELRNQYTLGYLRGPKARDSKLHKVKVTLNAENAKKLRVYARKAFCETTD